MSARRRMLTGSNLRLMHRRFEYNEALAVGPDGRFRPLTPGSPG